MALLEGWTMLCWHGVKGLPCAVIAPLSHQEQQWLLQQVPLTGMPVMWVLCSVCTMCGTCMDMERGLDPMPQSH